MQPFWRTENVTAEDAEDAEELRGEWEMLHLLEHQSGCGRRKEMSPCRVSC